MTKDGGSIRVKLHDKLGALDKLIKLFGFDAKQPGSNSENPLHLLVQAMQGSALPVRTDAELRAARAIDYDNEN